MKKIYEQAIEALTNTYENDLTFIREFQKFKDNKITIDQYHSDLNLHGFRAFLKNFQVIRNVSRSNTQTLLKTTMDWINKNNSSDVDALTTHIQSGGVTHGKKMVSLSSKLLFLNNPRMIIPLDTRARRALGVSKNEYAAYSSKVNEFKNKHNSDLLQQLESNKKSLSSIEEKFTDIQGLEEIRFNRFLDKVLWVKGG